MIRGFTLCKKTDADLISFFSQQNEKTATLTVAALYAYITGTRVELPLLPVTVTEQTKKMSVCIGFKENASKRKDSKKRQEIKQAIEQFISTIPDGMVAMYIKGILRHTYGYLIYQTEATTPFGQNILPAYNTLSPVPDSKEEVVSTSTINSDSIPTDNSNDDNDDIFSLFESLL